MYRPYHTSIAETLFRSCQKLATFPPDCIYESNRAGLSISFFAYLGTSKKARAATSGWRICVV